MTRRKKTRKPGAIGVKSTPKVLRPKNAVTDPQSSKSGKGKPAGSRQSQDSGANQSGRVRSHASDPRVGSKRPIPLVVTEQPTPQPKPVPQAISPEAEFEQLENDPRLQQLLSDLDDGKTLSDADNAWMEKQLARYQALADQLGIELDDDDDEDELEPWKRFENPKDWLD